MDNIMIKTETDKLIEVMVLLLELQQNDQREVSLQIKVNGFREFFQNVESFDLSDEAKIKLLDLYCILQAVDVVESEGKEMEAEDK